ncbi:MAG: hypothetical protein WAU02_01925 [Candidatus Saccharimonadales bacterium]
MKTTLKQTGLSTAFAIIVMFMGGLALYITTNVAKIGFGGSGWPFWMGLATAFVLAGFLWLGWQAAGTKTTQWAGFAIVVGLLVATGLFVWRWVTLENWEWSQFWWGTLVLATVLVSSGILWLYKKL